MWVCMNMMSFTKKTNVYTFKNHPELSSHSLFSSRLLFIANCVSSLATHSNQCSVSAWTFNTPGQTTKGPLNSHAKQHRIQKPTLALCFYLLLRTILGPPVKARLWGDGTFGNGQEPKGDLTGITLALGFWIERWGEGEEPRRKEKTGTPDNWGGSRPWLSHHNTHLQTHTNLPQASATTGSQLKCPLWVEGVPGSALDLRNKRQWLNCMATPYSQGCVGLGLIRIVYSI